jgi:hypothetical protein
MIMKSSYYFVFNHSSSLHRPTSSSSTTNFPWLSPCLLVRVLLPILLVACNRFAYIAEERIWTLSKHISRDRYPASLLARQSDIQKICHVIIIRCCDVTADTDKTTSSIVAWTSNGLFTKNLSSCLPTLCLAICVHVTILYSWQPHGNWYSRNGSMSRSYLRIPLLPTLRRYESGTNQNTPIVPHLTQPITQLLRDQFQYMFRWWTNCA